MHNASDGMHSTREAVLNRRFTISSVPNLWKLSCRASRSGAEEKIGAKKYWCP